MFPFSISEEKRETISQALSVYIDHILGLKDMPEDDRILIKQAIEVLFLPSAKPAQPVMPAARAYPVPNAGVSVIERGAYTYVTLLRNLCDRAIRIQICPRDPEKDSLPEVQIFYPQDNECRAPETLHGQTALDLIEMLRTSGIPLDENGKLDKTPTPMPDYFHFPPGMMMPASRLSENDKDWDNPEFRAVYLALARVDKAAESNDFLSWLNNNGFCNLTVCPECRVDDFTHVEGCSIAAELDKE